MTRCGVSGAKAYATKLPLALVDEVFDLEAQRVISTRVNKRRRRKRGWRRIGMRWKRSMQASPREEAMVGMPPVTMPRGSGKPTDSLRIREAQAPSERTSYLASSADAARSRRPRQPRPNRHSGVRLYAQDQHPASNTATTQDDD